MGNNGGETCLPQAFFAASLLYALAAGKLVSAVLAQASRRERLAFFLLAPAMSINTWRRRRPVCPADLKRLAKAGLATFLPLAAFYAVGRPVVRWLEPPSAIRSYLCLLRFLLATTAVGLIVQAVFASFGTQIQALHVRPWASRTIGEFWGRRWNCVAADWLRQVCFNPLRRQPRAAILFTFAASGIAHELFLNVPLALAFGSGVPGSMFLYFAIQGAGFFAGRAWFRSWHPLERAFSWCVVLLPSPLILNDGVIRLFRFVG